MLAKLICWGATRGEAIVRMARALDEYRLMGLNTNIPFHQKLMRSHHFISGKFDTSYIEHYYTPNSDDVDEHKMRTAAIIATLVAHQQAQQAAQIVGPNERDTSNWKWVGRWERMHR